MKKSRINIPTWDVLSGFGSVVPSSSWVTQVAKTPIFGVRSDLVDETPPFKGSPIVAKPKKLHKPPMSEFDKWKLKMRLARKGIVLENKKKVIRLTRRNPIAKDVPSISFGVYKKQVKLTRFVSHFKGEFYPQTITNNDFKEIFTNDRCAAWYGSTGIFKFDHMARYYTPGVTANLSHIKNAVVNASKDFNPDLVIIQRIIKNALPRPEDFFPACNLIAVLVELRPTLSMAKDTARLLNNMLRTFSKGNRNFGNALENAAEARLWANFGVSPTASDVAALLGLMLHFRDLVQSYNKLAQTRVHTIHRTILRSDLDLAVNEVSNILIGYKPFANNFLKYGDASIEANAQVVGKLTFKIRLKPLSNTWAERVLQNLLGLDDILVGLWEGVPFSWLVDYFTNMSELIEYYTSTDLILPYEILDASYSWSVEGTATVKQSCQIGVDAFVTQRLLRKNGKTYFNPGETVYEKVSYTVDGEIPYDFKFYQRSNRTQMCKILAQVPDMELLGFKLKRPSLSRILNAASVGYLKARGSKNKYTKGV